MSFTSIALRRVAISVVATPRQGGGFGRVRHRGLGEGTDVAAVAVRIGGRGAAVVAAAGRIGHWISPLFPFANIHRARFEGGLGRTVITILLSDFFARGGCAI